MLVEFRIESNTICYLKSTNTMYSSYTSIIMHNDARYSAVCVCVFFFNACFCFYVLRFSLSLSLCLITRPVECSRCREIRFRSATNAAAFVGRTYADVRHRNDARRCCSSSCYVSSRPPEWPNAGWTWSAMCDFVNL